MQQQIAVLKHHGRALAAALMCHIPAAARLAVATRRLQAANKRLAEHIELGRQIGGSRV